MKSANTGSHGPKGGTGGGHIGGGIPPAVLLNEVAKKFAELSELFEQLGAALGTAPEPGDKGSYAATK